MMTTILFFQFDPPHSLNQLIVLYNIRFKRIKGWMLSGFCDMFGNIF